MQNASSGPAHAQGVIGGVVVVVIIVDTKITKFGDLGI